MTICRASVFTATSKSIALASNLGEPSESVWVPNTDVLISESDLVIKVELAGITKEDIELIAEDNRLIIQGHRSDCCREENKNCTFLIMEISYGSFKTELEIPTEFDLSKATASYLNGFLKIIVPKKEKCSSKNHIIPIKADE
jgi:HSP20 family protein